jgi:hypothetical protein
MKSFESPGVTPEHTNKFTKVQIRVEAIGDYGDMESFAIC